MDTRCPGDSTAVHATFALIAKVDLKQLVGSYLEAGLLFVLLRLCCAISLHSIQVLCMHSLTNRTLPSCAIDRRCYVASGKWLFRGS